MSKPTQRPPSSTAGPNLFIFVGGQAGSTTTKDKEIEQSKARSHAAAISHQRRGRTKAGLQPASIASYEHSVSARQSRSILDSQKPDFILRDPNSNEMVETPLVGMSNASCPSCSVTGIFCAYHQCHGATTKLDLVCDKSAQNRESLLTVMSSLRPGFGCFRDEQFAGIPNGSNGDVRDIVDFYLQIVNPANDLTTEIFNVTNVYPSWVPFLSCPLYYHAGLALIGAIRERVKTGTTYQCSPRLLRYRGQAMKSIRTHLNYSDRQGPSLNHGLATAMITLAILEYASGQLENARRHVQGLKTTIDALGGLENLPSIESTQERASVTYFWAFFGIAWGASDFRHDTRRWQQTYPGPPTKIQLQTLFDKLPPGFSDLAIEGKLCLDTIRILQRAVNVDIKRNDEAIQRARADRRREPRIYDNFVEACPIWLEPDDDRGVTMDKMICFALLVFCSSGPPTVKTTASFFSLGKTELSSRVRSFQPCTIAESECLVWLFIIAIDSCRTSRRNGYTLTDEGRDLLACFHQKFPELTCTHEWDDIELVLQRFFWTAELSRFWGRSWDDLNQGWALTVMHESCSR